MIPLIVDPGKGISYGKTFFSLDFYSFDDTLVDGRNSGPRLHDFK